MIFQHLFSLCYLIFFYYGRLNLINELLCGEPSFSHDKFQELTNIHLEEQELNRSETELQSIFPE